MTFQINKVYNFVTHAPSLFSDNFKKVKVIAIGGYDVAMKYTDVNIVQRQIYPYLPPGTPDDVKQYTYVILKSTSGITHVLAMAWIEESSIEEISSINIEVKVFDIDNTDEEKIIALLNSMGYKFSMKLFNT